MPVAENPETILYLYLTAPRVSAPRWYHEGIATFIETWMAGGLGRAQGPYDEMVFRSMVRDDAHFYSPVGLESEGIFVDFQATKSQRGMPWHVLPMKDVGGCEKPRGAVYLASIRGCPNGETQHSSWSVTLV